MQGAMSKIEETVSEVAVPLTHPPKEEVYESEHVHQVYERIAKHFSSTRYKPWPIVEDFLRRLPVGSIGLDVGCGNGKYLAVNPNVFIIGSDRSESLVKIASTHEPHTSLVADMLSLPHPPRLFDFVIAIAVVHHLSTSQRRQDAIKAMLECLRPAEHGKGQSSAEDPTLGPEVTPVYAGKLLIYVWALEQKTSRRGWSESDEQDVLVPWVTDNGNTKVLRYYHLYRAGDLERDITEAGGVVLDSGYEKDNWWAIAARSW